MIVRSITPHHFGAFFKPTEIELDSDLTVFTGPNDTGKSCALNAIRILCAQQRMVETDVHNSRFGMHSGTWDTDPEVSISAAFELTSDSIGGGYVAGKVQVGDIVYVRYHGNSKNQGCHVQRVNRGKGVTITGGFGIRKLPKIVQLRPDAEIRSSVNLSSMNSAESQLFKLAFGPEFMASIFTSLSQAARSQRLDMAQSKLNTRLRQFFPSTLPFEFRLYDVGGEGKAIGISLVDGVRGYAEVGLRGTGIRRLLSLMTLLLQEVNPQEHTFVILDEPETSLHADAQHQLRRSLEQLAAGPRVQVVYATHSPSMVNPARPERVRVFSRHLEGDVATSKVVKLSYRENFQNVRISLGLTPADSLLYGLVTIIVEGDTEARCLGSLLRRLDKDDVDGFNGVSTLLEASHFVCGCGNSISYYCSIARDQNGRPIAFLDGDKRREADGLRRSGIPVIELRRGSEFEQIVPENRYIDAVAEEARALGLPAEALTPDAFKEWSSAAGLRQELMFSKRVQLWMEDIIGRSLNKHAVMERAINLTPTEEIATEVLRELVAAIRDEFERA